jgi:hypothetical protein
LFESSGLTRPCNSPNSLIPARTLFLPGGEVFNEAEPCNIHAKIPRKKLKQCRKRPHRWSSVFDHIEVTARGSAGPPRVRHSVQKSHKGGPDSHNKCEKSKSFPKDCPCKSHLRVQPDQHNMCEKLKSFPKDYPCNSRLRVQPDQHNKCEKSKSFPKDYPCKSCLRVQPDQHNKCEKSKSFPKDSPCKSRPRVPPE